MTASEKKSAELAKKLEAAELSSVAVAAVAALLLPQADGAAVPGATMVGGDGVGPRRCARQGIVGGACTSQRRKRRLCASASLRGRRSYIIVGMCQWACPAKLPVQRRAAAALLGFFRALTCSLRVTGTASAS